MQKTTVKAIPPAWRGKKTRYDSSDDHPHEDCAFVVILMATTSILLRLFYSSSVSVPLRSTTTSGDDHLHNRTPCACVIIFMETTSIWLPLFYSSSVSVSLRTTTTSDMTTNSTEHPAHHNDIHGNHKHLGTVVLFLNCKCATAYHNHTWTTR